MIRRAQGPVSRRVIEIRRGRVALVAAFASAGVLTGCASAPAPAAPAMPPSTAAPVSSAAPASSAPVPPPAPAAPPQNCPLPQTGFDCDLQARIQSVADYTRHRPGQIGVVVRDRQTGAVWRNDAADTRMWTESTIKLAMSVDLFLRDHAGTISLTDGDRSLIQRMLHSSDDDAADALWSKFSGSDHMAFNRDFPKYGMISLQPQTGYSKIFPYWGFQKCTPNDLDRLVTYVLTQLPAETRDYIVGQLSAVDPDQQWGVWAAGPAQRPGNKDGWGPEDNGWVMNTAGWAGPGQRYTLVVMNSLDGHGGYDDGRTTDSHIAELLFTGRH